VISITLNICSQTCGMVMVMLPTF